MPDCAGESFLLILFTWPGRDLYDGSHLCVSLLSLGTSGLAAELGARLLSIRLLL